MRVKAKGKWKPVNIAPHVPEGTDLEGFIGMEVLTEYDLFEQTHEVQETAGKKTKTKALDKKTISEKGTLETDHDESTSAKKKKGKRKKKKKPASDGTDNPDEPTEEVPEEVKCATKNESEMIKKKKNKPKKMKALKEVQGVGDAVEIIESVMQLDDTEVSEQSKLSRKRKQSTPDVGPAKKKAQKLKGPEGHDETESDDNPVLPKPKPMIDMSKWYNLFIPEPVLQALSDAGFENPTQIQLHCLPSAIAGKKDILGAAETGSGKTLAFGIPMIHNILKYKAAHPIGGSDTEEEDDEGSDTEEEDNEGSDTEEEDNEGSDGDDMDVIESEDKEGTDEERDEDAASEADSEEDEDTNGDEVEDDLAPGELEEFNELADDELGCVASISNVEFDWLDEDCRGKAKVKKAAKVSSQHRKPLLGLVLTPTRELAVQVKNHLQVAAAHTDIQICCVVGGMSSEKQTRLLRRCPEIVVATPGRLWELIQLGDPHLSKVVNIGTLVIDEADRMVEKGHYEELDNLFTLINSDERRRKARQNLVFSATLTLVHSGPNRMFKNKKKERLTSTMKLDALMAKIGLHDKPKVVDLTRKMGTAESLVESRINCSKEEKDFYLYYFLHHYKGRTLVFTNSKDCLRRLVSVLTLLQCNPLPLHADMHQRQRLKNLDRFKAQPNSLLLATDVAARGLDIPNVQHVIHYQVPRTSENYIHRSGRTARVKKEGLSVVMIGPEDMSNYRRIINTLNRQEDLPVFPVEAEHMPPIRDRVKMARQIDIEEHQISKQTRENSWFEKAAEEMDIILDDPHLLNDLGDREDQDVQRSKIKAWRQQLNAMLSRPAIPREFSGKYPTKSGKLKLPYTRESALDDACTAVRKEASRGGKRTQPRTIKSKGSKQFRKKKSSKCST